MQIFLTRAALPKILEEIVSRLLDGGATTVKIENHTHPTKEARGLYWVWMDQAAAHFSRKGNSFTKDDLHDLMRHQFLGYTEPRVVGKTQIQSELKSTKNLTKIEFCCYMEQVDHWCSDHGVLLTRGKDEYSEFLEEHRKP